MAHRPGAGAQVVLPPLQADVPDHLNPAWHPLGVASHVVAGIPSSVWLLQSLSMPSQISFVGATVCMQLCAPVLASQATFPLAHGPNLPGTAHGPPAVHGILQTPL